MKRRFAGLVLWLTRWEIEGEVSASPSYVLIAAPHTSNWDLVYLLMLSWSAGVSVSWMGKHQLFRPPFGGVMRWLGGVPVRRDRRNDLVSQLVEAFEKSPCLVLTVPPEGTRRRVEYWKSGFYRIAVAADVPIVPGYLDYARRRGGFGPELRPSGDVKKDMDFLRHVYSTKIGKYPEHFGPVRLAAED